MLASLPIRHLDCTVVFARDMTAMRAFYEQTMGFTVNRELGAGWVEYRVGACVLALTHRGVMFDDAPPPPDALSVQLAFRVTPGEVAECETYLRAHDVAIVGPPTDQPWGHRTLFFRDPDGNVLEFYADI